MQTRHATTAPTVVGYNKYDSRAGYKLMAASFISVADAKDQFSLADIKPDGYTKPSYNDTYQDPSWWSWEGGLTKMSFQINVLDEEGYSIECYEYVDYVEGPNRERESADNENYGPGWFKVVDDESTPMTEEEMKATKFDIGQAFFVYNGSGEEIALSSAGQVTANAIEFPAQAGYTGIGNGTAADLTLFDLMAKGYTPPTYNDTYQDPSWWSWEGGLTKMSFQINVLDEEGYSIGCYEYVDYVEGPNRERESEDNENYGPGWFKVVDDESTPMTEEEMKAVKVNAGDAYFVYNGSGEEGLSLFIPAADID